MNLIKRIATTALSLAIAFSVIPTVAGNMNTYAATRAPGKVTKLSVTEKNVGELIPFADIYKPKAEQRVVGISRTISLKWKKVKGASGYRVYLSKIGAKKGYKLVKTIPGNHAWKGYIDTGMISYNGAKHAQVWVKVRAYKKSGKKIRLGKNSKVLKIVVLQQPKVTAVQGAENNVTIKWNKVSGAMNYKVMIATAADVQAYREKYNKNRPKYQQLYPKSQKAFDAVAINVATTKNNTSSFNLPKEGNYFIQVVAINGKNKSEAEGDYAYYNWWKQ